MNPLPSTFVSNMENLADLHQHTLGVTQQLRVAFGVTLMKARHGAGVTRLLTQARHDSVACGTRGQAGQGDGPADSPTWYSVTPDRHSRRCRRGNDSAACLFACRCGHRLGHRHMTLEAERCCQDEVPLCQLAVTNLLAAGPRHQCPQAQQPDFAVQRRFARANRQPLDHAVGFADVAFSPRASSVSTRTPAVALRYPHCPVSNKVSTAFLIIGRAPSRSPVADISRAIHASTIGSSLA